MSTVGEAAAGAIAAGAFEVARRLRAAGLVVAVEGGRLAVSAAGLRAREFGSAAREPRPVVGPVVEAFGPELARMVAASIGEGRHE